MCFTFKMDWKNCYSSLIFLSDSSISSYCIHCTYALHTTHYTSHTTHYTPHTTHHTLQTTLHTTLHTIHCTLHTTHYTPHNTHHTLHTTHYTLHTTHYCRWPLQPPPGQCSSIQPDQSARGVCEEGGEEGGGAGSGGAELQGPVHHSQ